MRSGVLAAAALALSACAVDSAEQELISASQNACPAHREAFDSELVAQLDAIVDAAVKDGFAGQLAVMKDGVFVYRRAAGPPISQAPFWRRMKHSTTWPRSRNTSPPRSR